MAPLLRTALAVVAMTGTLALGVAQGKDVPTAKEGESGHRYPVTIESTLPQKTAKDTAAKAAPEVTGAKDAGKAKQKAEPKKLDLLGLGIREKTVLNVNVYSYVLYVDRALIEKDMARFKGKQLATLEKSKGLFTTLLTQNVTKELRLRFCRDVDAEDIVSAFEDSLEPRILGDKRGQPGTKAEKLKELTEFRSFFDVDEIKKGHELRFTWQPDGTLSTVVNGVRKKDLKSRSLCWALFDVYLGNDPISNSGKKKLIKRLPELLK